MLASTDLSQFEFLFDLATVLAAGLVASLIMAKLRLPVVAGLLLAGAVCGPSGMEWVQDKHTIDMLAELGVVMLLFTIGLEFPIRRFIKIGKTLVIGGGMQVGFTILAAAGVALAFGFDGPTATVIGFSLSLSSTAIVLRGLADRNETDAPHGRFIVGTLLFQDLCVIPLLLGLPVLAGGGEGGPVGLVTEVGRSMGIAVGAVLVTYVAAKLILPWLLKNVDQTRNREVFIIAILAICIGISLATASAGLSLALGAFLAGMVIADSPFSTRALTDVMPFKDLLTSIFFISLGMLLDFEVFSEKPFLVLSLFAVIVVGKGLLATIAALIMRFPVRTAVTAGLGLAQFGEFGFVIMTTAAEPHGLIDMGQEGRWLAAAGIMSMFVTPLMLKFAPSWAAGSSFLSPLEKLLGIREVQESVRQEKIQEHVIIAGFGTGGKLLAKALKAVDIPYVILEMNIETVQRATEAGEKAYYADVTSVESLEHAGIHRARAMVLTINDPSAVTRCIATVRQMSEDIPLYVRVRYATQRDVLLSAGATEVVSSEIEASVELMGLVLREMKVPRNIIHREIDIAREATKGKQIFTRSLRSLLDSSDLKVDMFQVEEGYFAIGQNLKELNLRGRTGVTVLACRRQGQFLPTDLEKTFEAADLLYLLGDAEQLANAACLLEAGTKPRESTRKIQN